MITIAMRKKLKILGYTLEEIKYLTPAQSNDIIKKSIIYSSKSGKLTGDELMVLVGNVLKCGDYYYIKY
jgi:hypothetical protein